jgi:hypothetical protein
VSLAAGAGVDPDAAAGRPDLVLAFARYAAKAGWSDASLRDFCEQAGVSPQAQHALWPQGARGAGRALNDLADARMLAHYGDRAAGSMAEIIMLRFEQNAEFKTAVGRLARADCWRPFDTLGRTAVTARLMWRCHGHPHPVTAFGEGLDRWLLVLVYCACVTAWLADRSPDLSLTRRTVRVCLALIGLR